MGPGRTEVELDGITDCDLCTDHYAWFCPGCGGGMDHFQTNEVPFEETCGACGHVSVVTAAAVEAWEKIYLYDAVKRALGK